MQPIDPTAVPAPDATPAPSSATDPTQPTTPVASETPAPAPAVADPTTPADVPASAPAPVEPTAKVGDLVTFHDMDPYTGDELTLYGLVVESFDDGANVAWLSTSSARAKLPWDTIRPLA